MDNDNAPMGGPLSEAERLAEIQARLDAATDGPWQDAGDVSGIETASGERITEGDTSGYGCVYISDEDRALIASAPADLTYLLDMAEDRRARVEALKATSRRVQERLTEATARVGVLEGQLATAQERLRELASKQDRIPDIDNGDWGIGWDDGYNAALGEVRYLAAEVLPETVAECHHRQEIYLEWHEFPVQSSKRVICSECSGQLVPWDQVDEASLVLWPCKDAVALGLDGGDSEAETRTTAPDTAMDEFEAAEDISRRWE